MCSWHLVTLGSVELGHHWFGGPTDQARYSSGPPKGQCLLYCTQLRSACPDDFRTFSRHSETVLKPWVWVLCRDAIITKTAHTYRRMSVTVWNELTLWLLCNVHQGSLSSMLTALGQITPSKYCKYIAKSIWIWFDSWIYIYIYTYGYIWKILMHCRNGAWKERSLCQSFSSLGYHVDSFWCTGFEGNALLLVHPLCGLLSVPFGIHSMWLCTLIW